MLIAELQGTVRVWKNGSLLATPFIDLTDEVEVATGRGLLGITVDPGFEQNGLVYLLYTVDEIFGEPDEPDTTRTFARLTRYAADPLDEFNTALLSSRAVLIGQNSDEGFPSCSRAHTVGTVRFARDGSLFVGAGDGAHFEFMDDGGDDPSCFLPDPFPGFSQDQDIGSFRAQDLDSIAGKILRIDPATGAGLADNPYFTGDANDHRSKVWVNGLRNPYRFTVRPGSPVPGTLYIGDVGWNQFEEINLAYGSENFGWPCYEGNAEQFNYQQDGDPAHSGCDTIETVDNPGPETRPLIWWSQSDPAHSFPTGFTGDCSVGGEFYTKANYPPQVRGAFFFTDCIRGWLKALVVDASDGFVSVEDVLTGITAPTDIEVDPVNGDLLIVELTGNILRLRFPDLARSDLDEDGDTDLRDYASWLVCFSGESNAPTTDCVNADVDSDNDVDFSDWQIMTQNASGPL